MSNFTYLKQKYHTYESITSLVRLRHVTDMNQSCRTYEWVMSSKNFLSHLFQKSPAYKGRESQRDSTLGEPSRVVSSFFKKSYIHKSVGTWGACLLCHTYSCVIYTQESCILLCHTYSYVIHTQVSYILKSQSRMSYILMYVWCKSVCHTYSRASLV